MTFKITLIYCIRYHIAYAIQARSDESKAILIITLISCDHVRKVIFRRLLLGVVKSFQIAFIKFIKRKERIQGNLLLVKKEY